MTDIINTALLRAMTAVSRVRAWLAEEAGQDLIEYAMLGGLIALAIVGVGIAVLTGAISDMATGIGRCIDFDSGTTCAPF